MISDKQTTRSAAWAVWMFATLLIAETVFAFALVLVRP
jgi:hypothetical protein